MKRLLLILGTVAFIFGCATGREYAGPNWQDLNEFPSGRGIGVELKVGQTFTRSGRASTLQSLPILREVSGSSS